MNRPTHKQMKAIKNMHGALGWAVPVCKTMREASDLIVRAKKEMDSNRDSSYDGIEDVLCQNDFH